MVNYMANIAKKQELLLKVQSEGICSSVVCEVHM